MLDVKGRQTGFGKKGNLDQKCRKQARGVFVEQAANPIPTPTRSRQSVMSLICCKMTGSYTRLCSAAHVRACVTGVETRRLADSCARPGIGCGKPEITGLVMLHGVLCPLVIVCALLAPILLSQHLQPATTHVGSHVSSPQATVSPGMPCPDAFTLYPSAGGL